MRGPVRVGAFDESTRGGQNRRRRAGLVQACPQRRRIAVEPAGVGLNVPRSAAQLVKHLAGPLGVRQRGRKGRTGAADTFRDAFRWNIFACGRVLFRSRRNGLGHIQEEAAENQRAKDRKEEKGTLVCSHKCSILDTRNFAQKLAAGVVQKSVTQNAAL